MMTDKERKILIFSFAAIMFAVIGIIFPISNTAFEVVVNNTNLAPTFAGETTGTGERFGNNTTYWANDSAIELFFFGHANTPSQALHISLYVNGTQMEHTELRPLGTAERTHAYVTGIIPKGAYYSVNASQYHHYEWREYPILSGQNGTLSINQTNIYNFNNTSGGSGASNLSQLTIDTNKNWLGYQIFNATFNGSFIGTINESQVNNLTSDLNLKVNKSGDTMTGDLIIDGSRINSTGFLFITNPSQLSLVGSSLNVRTNISNIPMYFISENRNNAKIFQDVYQGTSGGFNSGGGMTVRVSRGNTTVTDNLTGGDRLFQFTGQGMTNSTFKNLFAMSADLDSAFSHNSTSAPTTITFQNMPPNASAQVQVMKINSTGNIQILRPGKGIQLTSQDGTQTACITLSNAGVLTTTSGACT